MLFYSQKDVFFRRKMIYGIGTDIIETDRVKNAMQREQGLRESIFTGDEITYCEGMKNKYQHYAARFAAKEAFLKALGTGWRFGIKFTDVEVVHDVLGNPGIRLKGKAKEATEEKSIDTFHVSLSHSRDYAMATVVLEKLP